MITGSFVALLLSGGLLAISVLMLQVAARRRLLCSLLAVRLSFPRGLKVEEVENFLDGLSGLLLPWWRRWLGSPFIALETHADVRGIEHFLLVPESWERRVLALLSANLPGVRFTPTDVPNRELVVGAEYRLTDNQRGLGGDAAATSARLLSSLHPIGDGEAVVVSWVITPHPPVAPARMAAPDEKDWLTNPLATAKTSEAVGALRKKQAKPLLLAAGRIAVGAGNRDRARALLRQAEVGWHSVRTPGVHLERRWMTEGSAARRTKDRLPPLIEWPGAYNTEELARLIGFPIEAISVPGLMLGGCRPLAPSPAVPSTGTVIGDSNFPGSTRPLALDVQARLRHAHLLGPTGYGKSTLMVNMIVQDLEAGRGVVVLDPKGDLNQSVLERIPDHRLGDVVVLDPADSERPVGLNPLQSIDRDHQEVVTENLVGLFKSLYRNSWGPRLDDILRAAILTLSGVKGSTLCEVPLILTDRNFRRRVVGRLDDPVGLESFWGWYEALSDAERATAVGPVLNKVRAFTMRPRVRSIIGQSNPTLNLRDVLANRKVLLVSLATGLLGEEAAALLGALVVAELWHATMARAGHHQSARQPVMAYLDEWQHFVHLPIPMSSVHIVVYQFNRVFRNAIDAAVTKRDLNKWGVRIVQTVFDLPDGPEGDMVELILNAVDEYRVKRDGADIAYKLGAKAKNGGTIGRAPLGYVNARDMSEGRNIGIVKVDTERAPFMIAAFELYATGEFSLDSLAEELSLRGLRTRASGRHPSGPVSTTKLAVLLRDPYYVGYVTYKGELIEGRHEPLISQELFNGVQVILDARGGRGERRRRHHHYLKGAVWCGHCHDRGDESRMILQWANGHGGRYLYFFCVRKQQRLCDSRYVDGDAIEAAVEKLYATIHFPEELADRLRKAMDDAMKDEEKATRLLNKQLRAEIDQLNIQEENLIELAGDGKLAVDKVRRRIAGVQFKRAQAAARLSEDNERLQVGVDLMEKALRLLVDPQKLYLKLSPDQRRQMNLAIFEKLYVRRDRVDEAILRPPFDELLEARDVAQAYQGRGRETTVTDDDTAGLAHILLGVGSNKRVMVGAERLELPACSL